LALIAGTPPYDVCVKDAQKGVYDYFIYANMFSVARFLKGDDYEYKALIVDDQKSQN
jgi:hypothetical protein